MKRFFLSFFIILGFSLFFYKTPVYSRNGIPSTPTPFPIPTIEGLPFTGFTCGRLEQQCCYQEPFEIKLSKPGIIGIDTLFWALESFINNITSPIREKLNDIAQDLTPPCTEGGPSTPDNPSSPGCICISPTPEPLEALKDLCEVVDSSERQSCLNCITEKEGSIGVWTAAGCIEGSFAGFIQEELLGWGLGIAGGIAFLCIIYSAFVMQTSAGDPERLKKARQNLTSCIVGLLLIIFAVFILRLIGVEILKIPGFEP